SWRLSVGRVISPLINSLNSRPGEATVIRKSLASGWHAVFRIKADRASTKDTLVSLLASLPEPSIEVTSVSQGLLEYKPLTGAEALRMCMRSLPQSPTEIQSAIQKNYEAGKLSYPRTDSRRLGEVGLKWIERAAQQNGLPHDPDLVKE